MWSRRSSSSLIRKIGQSVALAVLVFGLGLGVLHVAVGLLVPTSPLSSPAVKAHDTRNTPPVAPGASSWTQVGKLQVVRLSGSAEQLGSEHGRLLSAAMVRTETAMWNVFDELVPNRMLQTLLLDWARWQYRDIIHNYTEERRYELAALAQRFTPDPFSGRIATYPRLAYLNALYDIALSFEHSPIIGCTTFSFAPSETANGHALLARNFDFEVDTIFDREKVVFVIHEQGKVPFLSVGWAGLLGVVSGMNIHGVAAVIHGARAGEAAKTGEPVPQGLRRILASATNTDEAVALLGLVPVMVSHKVIVSDRSGKAASVERVPGRAQDVIWLSPRAADTNHLVGSSASDPKNLQVMRTSSSVARFARAAELLHSDAAVDEHRAVALLRDKNGARGSKLPQGSRNAIDASIATHGVVFDTTSRIAYVSEGPHLSGRFVGIDLRKALEAMTAPLVSASSLALADADFISGEIAAEAGAAEENDPPNPSTP